MNTVERRPTVGIAHAAIWTTDLNRMCAFWERVFGVTVGQLYESKNRVGFKSRFLSFPSGPTIEVMAGPWVTERERDETVGYAHLAISLGSQAAVDELATLMRSEARLASGPRWTGDGYYEAVIVDPDSNLIEITA